MPHSKPFNPIITQQFPMRQKTGNEFTLRDLLAAAAINGMLSDPTTGLELKGFCEAAWEVADEMLAQREK